MSFTTAALVLTWVALVILALGFAGLLRQFNALTAGQSQAVGPGAVSSVVGLALPTSGPLAAARPRGRGLVVATSPDCVACHEVLADLDGYPGLESLGDIVVLSLGQCDPTSRFRCVPEAGELGTMLAVPATPYLLAVDEHSTITDTLVPTGSHELTQWLDAMSPRSRPDLSVRNG